MVFTLQLPRGIHKVVLLCCSIPGQGNLNFLVKFLWPICIIINAYHFSSQPLLELATDLSSLPATWIRKTTRSVVMYYWVHKQCFWFRDISVVSMGKLCMFKICITERTACWVFNMLEYWHHIKTHQENLRGHGQRNVVPFLMLWYKILHNCTVWSL